MMIVSLTDIHLVLFLSRATPLARWERMGIYSRETSLYKILARHLGKLSILTSGGAEELKFQPDLENIEILYNRWGLSPNLYSLLAPVLHRLALNRATVFKTNQMDGAWTAILAGALHHKPVIVRAGYLWAELNRQMGGRGPKAALFDGLQAFSLAKAERIFVTSEEIARRVEQTYRLTPRKLAVIPNYVDTSKFRPQPEMERVNGRLCFIGRLHPIKNLESLLHAVTNLPGTTLIVIGEGEQRQSLLELAEQQHASVAFLGVLPHDRIPQEINRSQVFILPSLSEGHPKALIEAMACGAAVIGSNVPGVRELIHAGETGWLCETDTDSIRSTIQQVLDHPDLAARMGRQARQFILENFSLESVAQMELSAIRETCASWRSMHGGRP
jgi:glycosyltransferase involved in cell wall biosynthesis